jgi:hypothetical protein
MKSVTRFLPLLPRTVAAVMTLATLALLTAACSASPASAGSAGSADAGGSASSRSDVAFSACMRSHGLPNYPDPIVVGGVTTLPKESAQHLGVSSSRFDAAQTSCQPMLPATGGSLTASSLQQCYLAGVCPQALVQQAMNAGRLFAQCMRSHGVPSWPDPSIDAEGRPLFNIQVPRPTPAETGTAISACSRLDHSGSLLAWG